MKNIIFALLIVMSLFVWPVLKVVPDAVASDILNTERLPFETDAFDASFDPQGNLHLIYALRGNVYSVVRPAGTTRFTSPRKIDPTGAKISVVSGEGGPKLAIGNQGELYVVWQTAKGISFFHSQDSGRHWNSSIVRDPGASGEIELPVVAAGPNGLVYVAWIDFRDPKLSDDLVAANIYFDMSNNGGKTFGNDRNLTVDKIRACPCCLLAMRADNQGRAWIAYRSSIKNIKDICLLRSTPGGKLFTSIPLSNHRWKYKGCPASGPVLSVNPSGKNVLVAWTNKRYMYASFSSDGSKTFSHPTKLGAGNYLSTAISSVGTQLLVWDDGLKIGAKRFGFAPYKQKVNVQPGGRLLPTQVESFLLLKGYDS